MLNYKPITFLLSILGIIFFLITSCQVEDETKLKEELFLNYNIKAKKLIDSLGIDQEDLTILIEKSAYKLTLLQKSKAIKEYPIVLGENPIDDKRMEGDKCTPEGNFRIRDLYPHKSWSKFIWIDYPTSDSEKKFKISKKNKEIPQNATIGGEVGIHGVPKGKDYLIFEKSNWTWGCISLTNESINDLYAVCFKGMKIKIKH